MLFASPVISATDSLSPVVRHHQSFPRLAVNGAGAKFFLIHLILRSCGRIYSIMIAASVLPSRRFAKNNTTYYSKFNVDCCLFGFLKVIFSSVDLLHGCQDMCVQRLINITLL